MTERVRAFALADGSKAYFFRGSEYLRFDLRERRVDEGYPMRISEGWPGVWSDGIDAAFAVDDHTAYFFRGSEYVRFDLDEDRVDEGYPMAISDGWEGVWSEGVDAAFAREDGVAYFFRGAEYVRFDLDEDRVDEGYPMAITDGWEGVWSDSLDAALRVGRKVHFLRGGFDARFDLARDRADKGYPRPIARAFPGVWSADEAPAQEAPPVAHAELFAEVLSRFERFAPSAQGRTEVGAVFFEDDPAPALRAVCAAKGIRFEDPDFAANAAAMCSPFDDDAEYREALGELSRRCEWLRPDALAARAGAAEAVLFDDAGAAAGDLEQGETGDCWLLGAVAALAARDPARLRGRLFTEPELDPWGVCSVRLAVDGRQGFIVIDDRIPWDPVGERPVFVRSTARGELWPLLLEKAFAKWAGCWQHLRGGLQGDDVPLGDEALSALGGGGEVSRAQWRDRNGGDYVRATDLWDLLRAWNAEGRLVTVGCASGAQGLVSDHVYTALDLAEVADDAGVPRRFVCLRNPWASGEWRGAWSDRSPLWESDPLATRLSEALHRAAEDRLRDDGAFVMPWDDFIDRFEDATGVQLRRATEEEP